MDGIGRVMLRAHLHDVETDLDMHWRDWIVRSGAEKVKNINRLPGRHAAFVPYWGLDCDARESVAEYLGDGGRPDDADGHDLDGMIDKALERKNEYLIVHAVLDVSRYSTYGEVRDRLGSWSCGVSIRGEWDDPFALYEAGS